MDVFYFNFSGLIRLSQVYPVADIKKGSHWMAFGALRASGLMLTLVHRLINYAMQLRGTLTTDLAAASQSDKSQGL